jgi:hypothetical protein
MGVIERSFQRIDRAEITFGAWLLIVSPPAWYLAGADFQWWEPWILPAIGVAILVYLRVRKPLAPDHVVEIAYVDFEDGPPYYEPSCDCGWEGARWPDESSARDEGRRHANVVLTRVENYR